MDKSEITGDFWNRAFDNPKSAKAGCYGTMLAALVGLIGLVGYCSAGGERPSDNPANSTQSRPNEIDIVSECDLTAKARMVSPISFSPAAAWDYKDFGTYATVLRKYESANGFGANIGGTYLCKWDKTGTGRVASLETIDAMGNHSRVK